MALNIGVFRKISTACGYILQCHAIVPVGLHTHHSASGPAQAVYGGGQLAQWDSSGTGFAGRG
jgi:hypothetical protein